MAAFHNKILRVNLTTGQITVEEPGIAYLRRNIGGWGIIVETLLKEVPARADPLGPENKLIFAPSVLTGLAVAGASRNAVGAKSPLSGGFGAGEVGGFWGAEFKRAGFDALIVEGVSPRPVVLWIKDGTVELRDAEALWGQPTKETQEAIRAELGDKHVQVAMIGIGGENLVRYACVMNGLKDAAGRCGLGAVMGSKRLKAVAVRGTQGLRGQDHERVQELGRAMTKAITDGKVAAGQHQWGTGRYLADSLLTGNLPIHNFRDGEFAGAANLGGEVFMPKIGKGMDGCFACAVRCKKVVQADEPYRLDPDYGGPEYESVGLLGSACGVDDIVAVSKATELCNAYSLDTITTGGCIALAMECFEKGLIDETDTDGIDLRFGNGDAVIQMVDKIAHKEGLGAVLAEGPLRAARQIGHGAEAFAVQVKNQTYPAHEARFQRGLAISYAVSPTGADHQHALHDPGLDRVTEDGLLANATLRTMGLLDPIPLESLGVDKVRAVRQQMIFQIMNNCLTLCNFVTWSLDETVALVRAATGWDVSAYELLILGERVLTLARLYNMREGLTAADDEPAPRTYEPTRNGILSHGGLDPEALRAAIHTYYGLMGWDRETGVPRADTLHALNASWAVDYLAQVELQACTACEAEVPQVQS
ncbi:MAG: aldehyde ferredoxin oxidoreductase family protein [Anaerolineales bacterium]